MKHVSEESCRENRNKHFMFNNFFTKKRRVLDNVEKYLEQGKPQMTIWRMHTKCWIPKATNTHSKCVILIAVPLHQWLHQGASMLRYADYLSLSLFLFFLKKKVLT